jgi:hypothetical protein
MLFDKARLLIERFEGLLLENLKTFEFAETQAWHGLAAVQVSLCGEFGELGQGPR